MKLSWKAGPAVDGAEQRLNEHILRVQGSREECLIRAEVVEPKKRGWFRICWAWWPESSLAWNLGAGTPLQLQRLPTG